jgi:hypothetical protein
MYKIARQHHVKYILAGYNFNTESILPQSWSYGHFDWKYIKSIQRLFGTIKLKTFPHRTFIDEIIDRRIRKIRMISILDFIDYVKESAMDTLRKEAGWEYYGGKHHESIYTRFFQAYILPAKFGYDKRKAHLSSMIVAGQITREQALKEMEKPLYDPKKLVEDKEYVLSKFGISKDEFERIMHLPEKSFADYPSNETSKLQKVIKGPYLILKKTAMSFLIK